MPSTSVLRSTTWRTTSWWPLVADGGADQVGAVGVKAFLHQQIDLAQVDAAQVDAEAFVHRAGRPRVGGGGNAGFAWHEAILIPSAEYLWNF